ncbi:MAG: OadG family protein [Candidatus Marinimicrobia bacterium]|nr:OadG family protein [Candidatus Neomarinimicrobiota bacterium]
MKLKYSIFSFILILLPLYTFAETGIPEENRKLIYSITVVGILIVLFALVIVSTAVGLMSKIIRLSEEKRTRSVQKDAKKDIAGVDEETAAAIAAASYLYRRSLEEEEKAILTIRKVIKPLSGWSNKAYGMRNPGIL